MLRAIVENILEAFKIFEEKYLESPTREFRIKVIPKKIIYEGEDFKIMIYPEEKVVEYSEGDKIYFFRIKEKGKLEIEILREGAKAIVEIHERKGIGIEGDLSVLEKEIEYLKSVSGRLQYFYKEIEEKGKEYNQNVEEALKKLKELNEKKIYLKRKVIGDLFDIEVKRDIIEVEIEGYIDDVVQLSRNLKEMFEKTSERIEKLCSELNYFI